MIDKSSKWLSIVAVCLACLPGSASLLIAQTATPPRGATILRVSAAETLAARPKAKILNVSPHSSSKPSVASTQAVSPMAESASGSQKVLTKAVRASSPALPDPVQSLPAAVPQIAVLGIPTDELMDLETSNHGLPHDSRTSDVSLKAITVSQLQEPPSVLESALIPQGPPTSDAEVDPAAWMHAIRAPLLQYQQQSELTLMDAIHGAIQFAPEIDILRAEVGIRQSEITRQQAGFDWNQFVQSTWDEKNFPVGSTLDGTLGRSEAHILQNSLGIQKRVAVGGQLKLAQDLGINDSNSQFFNPVNQARTRLALEYQQPLLQGAGRMVATSQINIAVANAAASEEDFLAGLQSHIIEVIAAYWDLTRRRGELIAQKRSYERAAQTAQVISNRTQLDVGPLQLARANATLATRRNSLLQAEYAVVFAQEQLLRLIFGPQFKASVNTEVITVTDFMGPIQRVDPDAEVQWSLQNRPEIRRSLQVIKRLSIEEGVARNQLLPLLGLTMSLSNQGLQGDRALGDALSDQFNLGDPTYGVGLAYTFPIGNRAAKANLRQVELRIRKFCKELEQVSSDVALEVRNASHSINLNGQQRDTTYKALSMAQWELRALQTRAELLLDGDQVGPLYLDNLLQSQDRLANAEIGFLTASTRYILAQFELQRANGSLLRSCP